MDERAIIELYNRRDENAIAECETAYGGYCLRIAGNILPDRRDCEECVNDTWLRAWERIPPDRPDCLRLYLAAITRNLALDRYRAAHREKRGGGAAELVLDELSEIAGALPDPADEIAERELAAAVSRFLRGIPDRDRRIFVRRCFHFDATARIAADFGIREGNVLKILSRTRARLRLYLEKEGYIL